jgi:hypothetical protein
MAWLFLDPHGDLAEKIIGPSRTVEKRTSCTSTHLTPISLMGTTRVIKGKRPLVASGLLEVMKKMWDDAWGLGGLAEGAQGGGEWMPRRSVRDKPMELALRLFTSHPEIARKISPFSVSWCGFIVCAL